MRLVIFINLFFFLQVKCSKILGIFPAPGYSQFILAEKLMVELAKRGHEITMVSPYMSNTKLENYKTIKTGELVFDNQEFDLFSLESANIFNNIKTTYEYGNLITETILKNADVQNLMHSKKQFDLVIVEQFFNEALHGFSELFSAPLVLFSSMGAVEWNSHLMGNLAIPSISPVSYTSYTSHMSFWERSRNVAASVYNYFYREFVAYPQQREYMSKYFPKSLNFNQIIHNASLMLLNSHFTTSESTLLPYNVIEIGGFHVTQNPLSKEIQEYLDSAKDGAILFSMGSNLKSSDLSNDTLKTIFSVFSKLKQKILWKFEKDLPKKPENILISKWLKQSDILAHPNVVLFITHGGLLSTTEAIFYGVPMVGVPIFGDQKMNVARSSRAGITKLLSYQLLSDERSLFETINETLYNPKFREHSKKLSDLIRDRPMKPLDLAVYWIEYVIRHKGLNFKLSTLNLYWFQFYMIDIAACLTIFLVTVLFILRKIIGALMNEFKSKNKNILNDKMIKTKLQ